MKENERKAGETAYQKIIDRHLLRVLPDGSNVLRLDRVFGHEITTPLAITDMRLRGLNDVFDPNMIKMMIDHVVPAKDTDTAIQGREMREFCKTHKIEFLDVGKESGICHAVIPEKGWVLPGKIYVMGDSHTCTHGAFGAFAAGIGSTELENAIITGLWICPPQKVFRVNFVGKLPANVFAKDLILTLIKKIGVNGATNAILEFGGSVIDAISVDGRMTLANMAVEAGATSGMMNVDQRTINYLWPALQKKFKNKARALQHYQRFNSDPDAEYDRIIEINVTNIVPVITINYSPGDVVAVAGLQGQKVDQVYIGSCTNGRLEDLRIAASIIRQMGGKIAKETRCIIVPATQHILRQAINEGLIDIFLEAGCYVNGPTCGACLGMSCGVIAPGETCVSTTNRNFEGRMGKEGMVHLASPATAALTAIYGKITEPTIEMCKRAMEDCLNAPKIVEVQLTEWEEVEFESPDYGGLMETIKVGQARDFSGEVFYLPLSNVNTDQIIPAKYLSLSGSGAFGKHCLENLLVSSEVKAKFYQSQILVAYENFGSGSSREQAVLALEEAGIGCVIALSFARIFETNMFARGLLCISLPIEIIDLLFLEKPEKIAINLNQKTVKWSDAKIGFEITDHQTELINSGGSVGVMLKLAAELQKDGKI